MGVNLISGLGGSAGFGSLALGRVDDGSGFVNISTIFEDGITFFGQTYSGLIVNNNGSVTFGAPRFSLTPGFVDDTGLAEIAVFFADVDTRGGTATATPGGTSTGSNRVYYYLDTANDRVIITWDDVGYFQNKTDKLNAFQLILSDRGAGDFDIEFRYEAINWVVGSAGAAGVARAGISAGTAAPGSFYELAISGNESQMLAAEELAGNTGEAGRWLFNIRAESLFDNWQNTVDFNNLLPSQAQAVLAGAQVGFAASGNDVVWLPDPDAYTLQGTTIWDANTRFDAGLGDDIVHGGDGRDLIFGNGGDDLLFGGDGNDVLRGGEGRDTLVGGAAIVGDGVSRVMPDNGIDVAVYEKPRDAYKVESIAGGFRVTDLGPGGRADDLYNIEYLLFNSPTTPAWADLRITQDFAIPPAGTDIYRLPYVYIDFEAEMTRIFSVIDIHTEDGSFQSVTSKPGFPALGRFTDAQKREIVQGVQAIFDRSGVEITVVAGRSPDAERATSVYFSAQKIFYDHDGNAATPAIRYRGEYVYSQPDFYNVIRDDDVFILMDGYQADGVTPVSAGEMQQLINTVAHELGHAFGLAHVTAPGNGANAMDDVSTAAESFANGITPLYGSTPDAFYVFEQNQFWLLNRYVVGTNTKDVTPGGIDLNQVQPSEFDQDGLNQVKFSLIMLAFTLQYFIQVLGVSTADSGDFDSYPLLPLDADGATLTLTLAEGQVIRILGASVEGGPADLVVAFDTPDGPVTELRVGQTMPTTGTVLKYATPGAAPQVLGTITLAVTGVESLGPPDAADDAANVAEDGSVVIAVLGNDAASDHGQSLSLVSVGAPAKGSAVINPDGTITYTPNANANGQDSFTYTVIDKAGDIGTATVTVAIAPVNDVPDAVNDSARAPRGGAVTIAVRANDVDADGDALAIASVGAALHGTAVANPNGTITYTPAANYVGPDSFTYTVSDGHGGTDTATVSVNVSDPRFRLVMFDGYAGGVGGAGEVFGTNGFQDLTILEGSYAVNLDGSFARGGDIVRLPGLASAYDIRLAGSTAVFSKGDMSVAIPVGSAGLPVVFDDGVRKLVFDGTALKIGAQAFSGVAGKILAPADDTPLPAGENPAAVARLLLLSQDGTYAIHGDAQIFGTNGVERITIVDGSVSLDGSFGRGGDTVAFNEGAANFAAYISGSSLVLVDDIDDDLIAIPIGTTGLRLDFDGEVRMLRFDLTAGKVMVGDQPITATSLVSAEDLVPSPPSAPPAALMPDALHFA